MLSKRVNVYKCRSVKKYKTEQTGSFSLFHYEKNNTQYRMGNIESSYIRRI